MKLRLPVGRLRCARLNTDAMAKRDRPMRRTGFERGAGINGD